MWAWRVWAGEGLSELAAGVACGLGNLARCLISHSLALPPSATPVDSLLQRSGRILQLQGLVDLVRPQLDLVQPPILVVDSLVTLKTSQEVCLAPVVLDNQQLHPPTLALVLARRRPTACLGARAPGACSPISRAMPSLRANLLEALEVLEPARQEVACLGPPALPRILSVGPLEPCSGEPPLALLLLRAPRLNSILQQAQIQW
ncbi:hypothetical protein chiPu_0020176 [Chiloscyllium punctatum]|uniref:Uncharacterized protein n=1 Tax=Chiloscyllium punctatum TaxID=137246 RepID=A0A401RUB3_CHIPU|nr:hypothetical protein [Chiloscyllium punctatum]